MESDLLQKPVRLHNFPGYLDRGVRFDCVDQTRPKTASVQSEDAGAGAEIDYHIARLHRKREGVAISVHANAIPHHLSISGKVVKVH